eukprot:10884085-Ditylum_brightwellii.AAC.1
MEEAQEETKGGRTIEDEIDRAITAEEALWAAAEEAEKKQWEEALQEEEDQMKWDKDQEQDQTDTKETESDINNITEMLDVEQHQKMDNSGYKEEIKYENAIAEEHAAMQKEFKNELWEDTEGKEEKWMEELNNTGKEKKMVKFAPSMEMTQSNIKGLMSLANAVKENHKISMGKTKEKTHKQNNIKMDILDNTDQMAVTYLTTKEQMKIRGASDVQHTVTYKTPVYIKFVVVETEKIHPLRNMFKELFTRMQRDDDTLTIRETLGKAIWSNPKELPAGKKFQKIFKVRKNNSMCGPPVC